MTIYHEIPLLREVFLNRGVTQANYGHDNEWWAGKAIEVPYLSGSEPDEREELTYELQRLMAFLDKTDRSYGSTDALANLSAVKKWQRRRNMEIEAAVLNAWKGGIETRETGQVSKVFSIGVAGEDREDKNDVTEFAILDIPFPPKNSSHETLYDIADAVLWPYPDSDTDISSSSYLEHIADVIVFRLEGDESHKNIEVPAVWYPDRYLKSGRQAALDMRLRRREIEENLERIALLQDGLTHVSVKGGEKHINVQSLFKAALQHDVRQINDDSGHSHSSEDAPMPVKPSKLSAELQMIVASIDRKLLGISNQGPW